MLTFFTKAIVLASYNITSAFNYYLLLKAGCDCRQEQGALPVSYSSHQPA